MREKRRFQPNVVVGNGFEIKIVEVFRFRCVALFIENVRHWNSELHLITEVTARVLLLGTLVTGDPIDLKEQILDLLFCLIFHISQSVCRSWNILSTGAQTTPFHH